MYFEAEILIDPSDVKTLEVPARSGLRALLSALTGGWRGVSDDQELWVGAALLQGLRQGLLAAGIDDVVRLARDGELVYHDERGRPADLDVAVARSGADERTRFDELRMVMQHREPTLHVVVDVHVFRVYPEDGIPIRVFVHGFSREFDVRSVPMGRGGDLVRSLCDLIRARLLQSPVINGDRSVPESFKAIVERLEQALCGALPGARASHWTRSVILMPRRRSREPASIPARTEPSAMAPFGGDPGLREATFYTTLWGSLCRLHDIRLQHMLLADAAGRPVLRVGDEPLLARQLHALEPGQPLESIPSLDVVVLTGHDRDAEVRAAQLVPADTERSGLAARLALRQHEIRTLSGFVPRFPPRERITAGGTLERMGVLSDFHRGTAAVDFSDGDGWL